MDTYKYTNADHTEAVKNGITHIAKGGKGWKEFEKFLANNGNVEPYRTKEEWMADAIIRLYRESYQLINSNLPGPHYGRDKHQKKYVKALRKEMKGNANANDVQLLDDNDSISDWYDDIDKEIDKTIIWINKNNTSIQELIDFDPATDVSWPTFPLLGA